MVNSFKIESSYITFNVTYSIQKDLMMTSTSKQLYNRPNGQLFKWIGNKFRYANEITSYFPDNYNNYMEPFLGTGAILSTLSPKKAYASDTLSPLIAFWNLLKEDHEKVIKYYEKVITEYYKDRNKIYNMIKEQYNNNPNPLDLMIISRTCYGGVLRFTLEKKISTPIGPHKPISPETFKKRALEWKYRIKNTTFINEDYGFLMAKANEDDLIYCDPPYIDSQKILYGSQSFNFEDLILKIQKAKKNGAKIALSIDGKKKSGKKNIDIDLPAGLFEREIYLNCGSSMLKRFQCEGQTMTGENVSDRLLLTW